VCVTRADARPEKPFARMSVASTTTSPSLNPSAPSKAAMPFASASSVMVFFGYSSCVTVTRAPGMYVVALLPSTSTRTAATRNSRMGMSPVSPARTVPCTCAVRPAASLAVRVYVPALTSGSRYTPAASVGTVSS
jgi:hypothetical protein